ncbi:MAG: aliphatic sulfonate ABC transporter substrate-binding protein [Candidatus Limnocylindrales bacterium]
MHLRTTTRAVILGAAVASLAFAATPGLAQSPSAGAAAPNPYPLTQGGTLNIDFATYNPLSLVIRDQQLLENALAPQGISVNWVQSAGSNKANEALRAAAIDVGSTAGSAALLARSNGSPIQVIDIYSQPEWAALVVPADSTIASVADLRGKHIAATKGTDPYFFLLQSLQEAGVPLEEVTIENLQHADGWAALANGSVDAWAGLDPIMANAEATAGAKLLYRNVGFNSYGFLNATEAFINERPDVAQTVVDAYEKAREWALANPDATAALLAEVASIDPAVAAKVIAERSNLGVDNVPGDAQRAVLGVIGPIFVGSGDVASQEQIDAALASLINPTFATAADPARIP